MYLWLFPDPMKLTITKGLQDLLTWSCAKFPARRFSGIDHRGALIAIRYSDGYLANMTIPNSLLEHAMERGSKEQQYLLANPDLILVPYFHGTTLEFSQKKDFYVEEMTKEWPYFPFLLLITGETYCLLHTSSKTEVPLVVTGQMPVCLQDKVTAFFGFLKNQKINK